ncbi:acetyl-CoA acetyltransferase [Aquisalimonas lutea]|uniref:acetyl-CoA acetyltransferase n=1 Tax=Aquisalimonas lutea TaxID=1327750 RepID=UPI0025B4B0BC|nr:acetyl-CoA acetyltransferase [Aquisalimonas lutea]MDN3519805.1 acetyl-CoA acetyltransferase [Aquisalimonas lutea]
MNGARTDAAIVGAATSDLGYTPDFSTLDLMAQAAHRALEDAGIGKDEVDGLFTATAQVHLPTLSLSEYLGIRPTYFDSTVHGGASNLSHVRHAIAALQSGQCEVALIVYGSTQRSELKRSGTRPAVAVPPPLEAPYGPMFPVTSYALMAQRHMSEFGTTREDLANVAVTASQWGSLNPDAFRRSVITVDDVLQSPLLSSPLRAKDCCLITDGGGALVITTRDRARSARQRPVHVLGTGEVTEHEGMINMPDLASTGAIRTGRVAFEQASLEPSEVDVVQIYDAFTINPIMILEDLGFCDKGAGSRIFAEGRASPGGDLPVNTSGGGLAYTHPGMFGIFTLLENVRQLRGEAGDRQVDHARIALAHGIGGTMSSHCTVILGSD